MATIGKITLASSATAAIRYADGKDKLGKETKDWLKDHGVDEKLVDSLQDRAVVKSGLNVDPDYASSQMKATRDAYGTHGKEAVRVIQSFSPSDLNPLNPDDWQKANAIGLETAQKAFPDYQVAVYTQLDGVGHKLHNHIVANMPNLTTGKKYHQQRDWELVATISNEIAMEHGLSIIDNDKTKDLDYDNKTASKDHEHRTMAERSLQNKGEYVWKDDLRSRIDSVMSDSSISSYKDFSERLNKNGVIVHDRGQTISYEFLDANKKHRRSRSTSLGKS